MKTQTLILLMTICIVSVTMNILQLELYSNHQYPYDPCEYQFTITDDSATVYDYGRKVGTIKLDGSLEQLMIKDNE